MTKKLTALTIAKFSSLLTLLTVLFPLYGYLDKPQYCSSDYQTYTYYCNSDIAAIITILLSLIIFSISWKWHRVGGIFLILSSISIITAINQEWGIPDMISLYVPLAIISGISFLIHDFKNKPLKPKSSDKIKIAKIIFIILNILFIISIGPLLINGSDMFGINVMWAIPGFIGFFIIDPILIKIFKNNTK